MREDEKPSQPLLLDFESSGAKEPVKIVKPDYKINDSHPGMLLNSQQSVISASAGIESSMKSQDISAVKSGADD